MNLSQESVAQEDRITLEMAPLFEAGILGRSATRYHHTSPSEEHLRRAELQALCSYSEGPEHKIAQVRQVHGTAVLSVEARHLRARAPMFRTDADAMYTEERDALLCIRTADCLPIFVCRDGSRPFVGLIHAGWRGLAGGIIPAFLKTVVRGVPSDHGKLMAVIGPAIGVGAYEVGPDVARHFSNVQERHGRTFVDLQAEATQALHAHGVEVRSAAFCTFRDNDRFYSHRKGDIGRNLNFIRFRRPPGMDR